MKNNYAYGSLASFLPLQENLFPLDVPSVFGRSAPLEVEIGFGTGEYITRLAAEDGSVNRLGFEQCAKRTLKTLRKLHDAHLSHVKLMRLDAVWGLRYLLKERSIARVHCLFPCPWPKKRHIRHRLFSPPILKLVNNRLQDHAQLYIVTDHRPYAEWIIENIPGTGFSLKEQIIPAKFNTKFERKWAEAGQSDFFELTLTKTEHQDAPAPGEWSMKTYFFDIVDFDKIRLESQWGPVTVKYGELLYDPKTKRAVVDAVVSEDERSQHMWILIVPTAKGWCVCPANGTVVLPTVGAQMAIDRVAEAVKAAR